MQYHVQCCSPVLVVTQIENVIKVAIPYTTNVHYLHLLIVFFPLPHWENIYDVRVYESTTGFFSKGR